MNLAEARQALVELGRGVRPKPGRVGLSLDEPIAVLTLENPEARNAVTVEMMVQLADAVARLSEWRGAALIVKSGHGGLFCSGGHLGQVRHAVDRPERAALMHGAMAAVLDALLALPVVSVSVLEGAAIGGGAELATATDFRFMSPDASLRFVHASYGIAPGWGGTKRLVQHLGRAAALKILVQSRPLDASAAAEAGLAVASEKPGMAATEFLQGITRHPSVGVRAVKEQVQADRDPAVVFSEVWGAPAHHAALEKLRAHQK